MASKTIKQTELIEGVKTTQVYDALLDPKTHAAFTGSAATGDPRVGGEFTAWDGYISGKHLELDPPRRIVQEWTTSEWPEDAPPSKIEWTFVQKDNGTEVTMVHSKVPESQVESYRQGWIDYYWGPLKKYFAKKSR